MFSDGTTSSMAVFDMFPCDFESYFDPNKNYVTFAAMLVILDIRVELCVRILVSKKISNVAPTSGSRGQSFFQLNYASIGLSQYPMRN